MTDWLPVICLAVLALACVVLGGALALLAHRGVRDVRQHIEIHHEEEVVVTLADDWDDDPADWWKRGERPPGESEEEEDE